MQAKGRFIEFFAPRKARLCTGVIDSEALAANEVLVRTEYTVISGGTEKAYLIGAPNTPQSFPTRLGYCGIGRVEAVGSGVENFKNGDRVLVYHGTHADYKIGRAHV